MAKKPANFSGGLELLLQRLRTGTASAQDQEWAAEMIAALSERIGKKQRTAYVDTQAAREHRIYLDVLAELPSAGSPDAIDKACAAVAARHNTARHYDANPGGKMSPATIRRYYDEQRAVDAAMGALRKLRPWDLHAAGEDDLNRLRMEHFLRTEAEAEAARKFRETRGKAAADGAHSEWLRALEEWQRGRGQE